MVTGEEARAAGAAALQLTWPGCSLGEPVQLDGGPRAVVVRCAVTGADVSSVVVKLHVDAPGRESHVREPAGFEVLDGAGVPRLLAVSTTPPGVVLADAGTGGDLADLLLGSDPVAATDGLVAWAEALAELHLSPYAGMGDALRRHATRLRRPVPALDDMPGRCETAAGELPQLLAGLGVTPSNRAVQGLAELCGLLSTDPGARAVTPADTCPDNNVLTPDGMVLLDLEGAQVRHIAWDVAYLTTPWPSCWCSWRLPEPAVLSALAAWRDRVPYGRTDPFEDDLRAVTVGWALLTTSWFLPAARDGDHTHGDVTPPRRAMLQHRLGLAAEVQDSRLLALTALCEQVLQASYDVWGHVPLELAPAFRG